METKHTQGPWTVNRIGEITSGKTRIAKVTSNGPTFGSPTMDDIANARLIAAAPDLLAALKAIQRGTIGGQVHFECACLICAAIARAEGKK